LNAFFNAQSQSQPQPINNNNQIPLQMEQMLKQLQCVQSTLDAQTEIISSRFENLAHAQQKQQQKQTQILDDFANLRKENKKMESKLQSISDKSITAQYLQSKFHSLTNKITELDISLKTEYAATITDDSPTASLELKCDEILSALCINDKAHQQSIAQLDRIFKNNTQHSRTTKKINSQMTVIHESLTFIEKKLLENLQKSKSNSNSEQLPQKSKSKYKPKNKIKKKQYNHNPHIALYTNTRRNARGEDMARCDNCGRLFDDSILQTKQKYTAITIIIIITKHNF
jgi:hypothetical protein